ncbi:hypothetical protein QVD17_03421 [Tagetes erecta]|uniref:Serine/threonine-protein phosphatase 4 regulatory subunit 3-like central domain-containing protein n=1 Tax=Tagetes erecta TaxID=13708 RepID=A0AAD8LAX9_TARER|nr:hypothetical protein QVD17_03417 [Tagetes erecta]KAK1437627.1 hypothetical protein QVD17_03421 [Tagetes erecta]
MLRSFFYCIFGIYVPFVSAIVVAAVRFIRILISHNDEHLANYIAKNNVLRSIVDTFISNGNCYNLLNSTVLELFEHIRKENLKILLKNYRHHSCGIQLWT